MNKQIKNICIYGVGGVGGYFGAKMLNCDVNKNYKISFVARGEHLNEIKSNGITLKTNSEEIKVCPNFATDNINEIDDIDLLIITVKGYDFDEVIGSIKNKIKEDTIILSLLNGADIYERIKSKITKGIVLPACVYISANIEKPGVISLNGADGKIIFGKDPKCSDYYPGNVINCFNELDIQFKYEKNPFKDIWTKYIFIAPYALVTAHSAKSMCQVLEDKALVKDLSSIMEEVKQIADKKNILLDEDIIEKSINKAKNFPYDAKTSYQRDIERGSKHNEGELFGGTIIRMGKEYAVETAVTEKYYI